MPSLVRFPLPRRIRYIGLINELPAFQARIKERRIHFSREQRTPPAATIAGKIRGSRFTIIYQARESGIDVAARSVIDRPPTGSHLDCLHLNCSCNRGELTQIAERVAFPVTTNINSTCKKRWPSKRAADRREWFSRRWSENYARARAFLYKHRGGRVIVPQYPRFIICRQ